VKPFTSSKTSRMNSSSRFTVKEIFICPDKLSICRCVRFSAHPIGSIPGVRCFSPGDPCFDHDRICQGTVPPDGAYAETGHEGCSEILSTSSCPDRQRQEKRSSRWGIRGFRRDPGLTPFQRPSHEPLSAKRLWCRCGNLTTFMH
jgi:hypothetical protein